MCPMVCRMAPHRDTVEHRTDYQRLCDSLLVERFGPLVTPRHPVRDLPAQLEGPRLPTTYTPTRQD